MPKHIFNIPNLLSFYRIAVVPVLTLFFFIEKAYPDLAYIATWINVFIYFCACISDYLDGVIARSSGQVSVFGKFIDHTSDKILIGGVLLLLVAFGRLTGIWLCFALIIFLREILVSGLREFLGQYNVAVPVSWMGKWKTAAQMFGLGFVMAGPTVGPALIPYSYQIGLFGFLVATVMTILSGWDYLKAGLETLQKLEAEKA